MSEALSLVGIKHELGLDDEELKDFTPMVLLLYYSSNTYAATNDLLGGRLEDVLNIVRDRRWLNTYTIYANNSSCEVEVFSREFRKLMIENCTVLELIQMLEYITTRDKGTFQFTGYPNDAVHSAMGKLAIGMQDRLINGIVSQPFIDIELTEGDAINMSGTMGVILLRAFDEPKVLEQMIRASRGKYD